MKALFATTAAGFARAPEGRDHTRREPSQPDALEAVESRAVCKRLAAEPMQRCATERPSATYTWIETQYRALHPRKKTVHSCVTKDAKRKAGAPIRTADLLITNPTRRTSEVPAFYGFS